MANKITYDVGFNVEKTSLTQLKSELNKIQQMSFSQFKIVDAQGSISELKKIQTVAHQVGDILESSFNPKLDSVNVEAFNRKLADSGLTLQQISTMFNSAGDTGKKAFQSLTAELLTSNRELKETHGLLAKMGETLGNTIKWSLSSSAINLITGSVQKAWGYTKRLDESLNNIRIVTSQSAEDMDKFAKKANNAAKSLGTATTQYTNASLIYYQQGLSDEEVQARTEVTLKAANVTGQSAAEVSEQLTAVWNGYKVVAEEAELYVDKLAAVAASTAADLEELSTGMSKVASAANTMGVDIDQLSAQLATIVSVTRQDAASIGTALKTIYARMGDLKVDGVDEFGTSLGDVSGQMRQMGIEVLDQQGNLRDMGDVIEEVAAKWGTWTDAQQQAAAVAMAGKRQYNNLIALFENWSMYEDALSTSQTSEGTLQKQQDTYMDSLEAHLAELATAGEKVYDAFFDSDSMKDLIDLVTKAVEGFANLIEAVGGGGNALMMLGAVAGKALGPQIGSFVGTWVRNQQNLNYNINQTKAELEVLHQLENINAPKEQRNMEKLIELKKQQLKLEQKLSEEQRAQNNEHLRKVAEALRAQEEAEDSLNALNELYQEMQGTKDTKNKTRKTIDFNASGLEGSTSGIDDEAEQRVLTAKNHINKAADKKKSLEVEKEGLENELDFASGEIGLTKDGLLTSGEEDAKEVLKLKEKIKDVNDQIALQQRELLKAEEEYTEALESQKKLKESQVDLNTAISETQNIASFSADLTDSAKRTSGFTTDIQNYDKQADAYKQQYNISGDIDFAAEAQKIQTDKKDPGKNQKEIEKQAKALNQLQKAQEKAATAQKHYKAAGQDVAKMLKDVTSGQDKNTKLTQAAQNTIIKVKTENQLFSQALNKVAAGEALTAQEAAALNRGLKDIEAAAKESSEQADELSNALMEQKNAIDAAREAQKAYEKELEDAIKAQKAEQLAQNITQLIGSLTALVGAIQAVVNIGDIWQNQNLSEGEQILQTIMAILGVLGSVASAVPIIQKIIQAAFANVGASGAAAGTAIQIGFLPVFLITLAIVAVLGVIIGLCALFGKETESATEKAAKALDAAQESALKLQEALQAAREEYSELMDEIEKYQDAKTALEELRVGTDEWKSAVEELNTQVLDLITLYPTLLDFMTSDENGVLSISQEGFDEIINQNQQKIKDAATSVAYSKVIVKANEKNLKETEMSDAGYDLKGEKSAVQNIVKRYKEDESIFAEGRKEKDGIDFKKLAFASSFRSNENVIEDLSKFFDADIVDDILTAVLEGMPDSFYAADIFDIETLTEAFEESYNSLEKNTKALVQNAKETSNLEQVYLRRLAEEQGIKDADTYANMALTVESLGNSYKNLLDNSETEFRKTVLAGAKKGINDDDALAEEVKKSIKELYGEDAIVTGLNDVKWGKVEDVKSFKGVEFKVNGTEMTGADLVAKYQEKYIEDYLLNANKELADKINEYAEAGIDTRAAYFMKGENFQYNQDIADKAKLSTSDLMRLQGSISDKDALANIGAYQKHFNQQRDLMFAEVADMTSLTGKEAGFANFTLDDFKVVQTNLLKAQAAGGGEAVASLYEKYADDADALALINKKMSSINDWGDTASVGKFLTELAEQGILIGENNVVWNQFMEDVYSGTKQWINNSKQVIENLATIKELSGSIQIGDILSEEDYKRLLAISPEVANMFIKTADGYKSLANSKDLDKILKNQYQSLGELKSFYNNVVSELDLSGVKGSLSVDFNKSGDAIDYMSKFASSKNIHNYDKLFDYAGTSKSAIEAAYEYITAEGVDKTSTEYIEYLNLLQATANKINQAALDKENDLLNDRQGQEIWATEIASSWGDIVANRANLDEDVYKKAEEMWKNTYLTEMGFSGVTAFNLGATELEEHLEKIRKLELNYYQDINAELDILSEKIDRAFGADRVTLLEKQAQLQEENLTRAKEQARIAKSAFDSLFAGFLSGAYATYGVREEDLMTDTGELDIVALRDLQSNYSPESEEYADIDNLIDMWELVSDAAGTAAEAAWSLIDAQIEAFRYQKEIQNQLNETTKQWVEFERKFRGYDTGNLGVYGEKSVIDMIDDAFEDYSTGKETFEGSLSTSLEKLAGIVDNYSDNISEYDTATANVTAANNSYSIAQKDLTEKQNNYNSFKASLATAEELKSAAEDAIKAQNSIDKIAQKEKKEIDKVQAESPLDAAFKKGTVAKTADGELEEDISKPKISLEAAGREEETAKAAVKAYAESLGVKYVDGMSIEDLTDTFETLKESVSYAKNTAEAAQVEERRLQADLTAAQEAQKQVAEKITKDNPYAAVAEDGSLVWDETAINEDWENFLSEGQSTLEDMQSQLLTLYDGYLQAQNELMELYDTEINKLTTINSILQGSADLWKLVGKNVENFSDNLTEYYQSITNNTAKTYQLANTKLLVAKAEYQKAMALGENASDEMIQTVSDNLAAATEEVVSAASEWMTAIANEFSVTMSAAIDDFIAQATDMDLTGITENWNLAQAKEERYLDDVNATYSIDSVERNFQKSIDATDSITAQKKLNSVMQEQLKILREKDKLSQYDIDRANAMYELTLKQIALEEAQQTANKMKLTRDASGNYTYQYVADQDEIAQAEEELAAAENELYNLDKDRNKTLVDDYYATMSEANEAIAAAMAEGDTERVERLKDYYFGEGGLLSGIQSELDAAQTNLQGIGSALKGADWTSSLASFSKAIVDSNLSQLATDVSGIVNNTTETLEDVSQIISDLLSQDDSVLNSSLNLLSTSLTDSGKIVEKTQELMNATDKVLTQLPTLTTEIKTLSDKLKGYGDKYSQWLEQQTGKTSEITDNTLALVESTKASREVARALYESMGLDVPVELAQDAEI